MEEEKQPTEKQFEIANRMIESVPDESELLDVLTATGLVLSKCIADAKGDKYIQLYFSVIGLCTNSLLRNEKLDGCRIVIKIKKR